MDLAWTRRHTCGWDCNGVSWKDHMRGKLLLQSGQRSQKHRNEEVLEKHCCSLLLLFHRLLLGIFPYLKFEVLPDSSLTFNKNYQESKIQKSDLLSSFQFTPLAAFVAIIDVLTSTPFLSFLEGSQFPSCKLESPICSFILLNCFLTVHLWQHRPFLCFWYF